MNELLTIKNRTYHFSLFAVQGFNVLWLIFIYVLQQVVFYTPRRIYIVTQWVNKNGGIIIAIF